MRKKICVDITPKKHALVSSSSERIHLKREKIFHIPLRKISGYAVLSWMILWFVFGAAYAPMSGGYSLAASTKESERSSLEAQLKEIEKQIAQDEATVASYKKQGKNLESEIKTLNARIAKLNLQIKSIVLSLQKLDSDISVTKTKITTTETDIDKYKNSLSAILQNLYENDQEGAIEMMMANPKMSDFFLNLNNLISIQDSLRTTLEKVVDLKNQLMDHKESLANQYDDVSQLKKYQELQQQIAKKTEQQKKDLLKETKGQESKYQEILNEKKKTAAQIRTRLYELLGGGELTFGEAYKFAKSASDATGVRAALILAVLDRESALGRNVGKCKYDVNPYYPAQANNPTTMHPTRDIPKFLEITKELGLDPKNVFVSCPIPRDGAWGGGMGPAQFIPSTWAGYKSQIAALTGHNPPSPWNNADAFMATAIYLKNSGAIGSLYNEKVAAAKYYAGSGWKNHINGYGARVVEKAEEFQDDIDVLNG